MYVCILYIVHNTYHTGYSIAKPLLATSSSSTCIALDTKKNAKEFDHKFLTELVLQTIRYLLFA